MIGVTLSIINIFQARGFTTGTAQITSDYSFPLNSLCCFVLYTSGNSLKMKSNPPKSVSLTTAQDIRNVFQSRDESSLQLGRYICNNHKVDLSWYIVGLTSLRDRLTIKYNEHVEVHDPRLQLLSTWLSSDEGAQTLFKLWEVTHVVSNNTWSII